MGFFASRKTLVTSAFAGRDEEESAMTVGTTEAIRQMTVSRDRTPIAWWRSGSGPDLLLVHGTTADHTRWETMLPLLEAHATVHAMDRRGRGGSGDAPAYSLAAEADDVAAVVEAIGRPVDVFGHSYGALVALEAALRSGGLHRLVLYEPALGATTFPAETARMERSLAEGRREDVIVTLLRDLAGMTDDQVAAARSLPSWKNRVAAAHTVVRETRAEEAYRFDPARFAGSGVPTLLLRGSESPRWLQRDTDVLADALPAARVVPLIGHGHVAMLSAPQLVVDLILGFVHEGGS
jgi:pimeloyl-ACP methyl ester carboxylesterase